VIKLDYPQAKAVDATVSLPGSKYQANRLLILTALCQDQSRLSNMPVNEDIETAIKGLSELGAEIFRQGDILECRGFADAPRSLTGEINSADSGSFSRFILPILGISGQTLTLSGSLKMNTRPMAELFQVLENLGATISSPHSISPSTLPITISGPINGGQCHLTGQTSSQYISALLMTAACFSDGLQLTLEQSPVSKPFIQMTLDLIRLFGIDVEVDARLMNFRIQGGQKYQAVDYQLATDPATASYFLGVAAITGGHICIENFDPSQSVQGEAQFASVLSMMGCKIWQDHQGLHCQGPARLQSVCIDMGKMPDVVQTLAVIACFAEGTSRIENIANLAFKESNRIEDTATEIRKTGIRVTTSADSMTITGGEPRTAIFDSHDDHRMAMSLALMALQVRDIQIRNPEVAGKSFPDYWQYLQQLGYALVDQSNQEMD